MVLQLTLAPRLTAGLKRCDLVNPSLVHEASHRGFSARLTRTWLKPDDEAR